MQEHTHPSESVQNEDFLKVSDCPSVILCILETDRVTKMLEIETLFIFREMNLGKLLNSCISEN